MALMQVRRSAAVTSRARLADASPGDLLRFEELDTLAKADIEAERRSLGVPKLPGAVHAVTLYDVTYVTTNAKGEKVAASGLAIVPQARAKALPLFSMQHGTSPGRDGGPSRDPESPDRYVATTFFAGGGYLVAMADYLGFAASAEPHPEKFYDPKLAHAKDANRKRVFHPYMHADSEASASLDMMRATRKLAKQLGIELSGQVMLGGYSQGGHGTMALHRLLCSTPALRKEFTVAGSVPMAGPHDQIGQKEFMMGKPHDLSAPALAYYLLGVDNRVGLAERVDQIFAKKYAEAAWSAFSDAPGTSWTSGLIGADPKKLLHPTFLASLYGTKGELNPHAPLYAALAADCTDSWNAGDQAIRLVHGRDDDQVSYAVNGPPVVKRMRAAGSRDIALITVPGDHETAALKAVAAAMTWLDGKRKR